MSSQKRIEHDDGSQSQVMKIRADEDTLNYAEVLGPTGRGRAILLRKLAEERGPTKHHPRRWHVRGVSPDWKSYAKQRAAQQGITVGQLITALLQRDKIEQDRAATRLERAS